jgi:hypothetical protein
MNDRPDVAMLNRSRFSSIGAAFAVLACVVVLGLSARPSAQSSNEYEVKAVFVLNFVKFVEWPESAFVDRSSPLVIAIVGDDPFGGALDRIILEKTINGRSLVLKKVSAAADFTAFQVLFISASERQRAPAILKNVIGTRALTVSDMDDFCGMGGMIHLSKQDQRIRFEVNLAAAAHAGLSISSKLLGLARSVYSEKGQL